MNPDLKAESLGGGVWRIPVPIMGLPIAYTLVYVLDSPRGPVLIDTGWPDEAAWESLTAGLRGFGMAVEDVYGVVVTHFHPDHAGLSGRVREASGAWIAGHAADVDLMRKIEEVTDQLGWEADNLRRGGASEEEVDAYLAGGGSGDLFEMPAKVDIELQDGDLIDLPGRRLRTVWTPGHAPGHVCLHLEDAERLFTGDHVLAKTTPHVGLYPFDLEDADPLSDFLGGLDKVAALPVQEVLPAHEYGFTDLTGRVGEMARHHEERLAELQGILGSGPLTLWQATARMTWHQPWDTMTPLSRQMAAAEAAAHLACLRSRGAARAAGGEGVARYVS